MKFSTLEASVEAILFAGGEPVPSRRICEVLSLDDISLKSIIKRINDRLADSGSALEIVTLDEQYQLTTRAEFKDPIRRALEIKRNTPLSQAAYEVLAVVAYNQPVTKAYIEQVRGVDCSGVINSLSLKGLIEEQGRLDLPGRPLLYGTTPNFLRCFSLTSLADLPPVPHENGADDPEQDGEESDGASDSTLQSPKDE